jgi:hypothetical protein
VRQFRHAQVANRRGGALDGVRGPEDLLKELRARAILLEANELLVKHLEHLVGLSNKDG